MIVRSGPFEMYTSRYDEWFQRNRFVYVSEIEAIRKHMLPDGKGLEVGVGTGRFATPLNIGFGLDPSGKMISIAHKRGIEVVQGVGEKLPFRDSGFDVVLMVTTLCFLDDAKAAFREVNRVLKTGGRFIIGLIDRDSPVGKLYMEKKDSSVFYSQATFYSVEEVLSLLDTSGFVDPVFTQTLFRDLGDTKDQEPVLEGYGKGSFVVVSASKTKVLHAEVRV